MSRPSRATLAVIAFGVVTALAAIAEPPSGIPLISIPQGVSVRVLGGAEVFLSREGSVVRVFPRANEAVRGEAIVWCPNEGAFVAPKNTSLFTIRGEFVAGPAPRDLDQLATDVDVNLILHVDASETVRAAGRSNGQVTGEVGDRYARFRAGDRFVSFCQNPVPAVPEAIPTPT